MLTTLAVLNLSSNSLSGESACPTRAGVVACEGNRSGNPERSVRPLSPTTRADWSTWGRPRRVSRGNGPRGSMVHWIRHRGPSSSLIRYRTRSGREGTNERCESPFVRSVSGRYSFVVRNRLPSHGDAFRSCLASEQRTTI